MREKNGEIIASTWSHETPLVGRAGGMVPGFAQMIGLIGDGNAWIARIPGAIGYGGAGL